MPEDADLMENDDAPQGCWPRRRGAWQPWSAPNQIPLRIAFGPFLLHVIA